jgi:hypothetical protein
MEPATCGSAAVASILDEGVANTAAATAADASVERIVPMTNSGTLVQ